MRFIAFNKATAPVGQDDLRVNTEAILYLEASRQDLVGQTTIHMLGQGSTVNAVTEPIGIVVRSIVEATGTLVACKRHYLAPPPEDGASTVYVSPANVSYLRPNPPVAPDFWVVRFVDGSELRVTHPLPPGL